MEMVPGAGRLNHLNSLPSCLHIQLKPNMFLVFFLDKSAIKVSFLLQALSCWTGSGNFFSHFVDVFHPDSHSHRIGG